MERTPHDVPLPVLRPRSRRRRIPRWRIVSLIAVNLLILAHILHWKFAGRTMASCQLSDAMHTLELGEINPGFILFSAALLATLLFGRFFCGWACHMGALQDCCAWILRRFGVRPTPLRSRLLGFIPLGLGCYMFIWPTLKRAAILPLLHSFAPGVAEWLKPVPPLPEASVVLTTHDLWDRLPDAVIAIPFLLICGCATVYFLGARGLCRFGCPYAGLLRPAAGVSIGSVVVDPSKCDGCGLCTAACSQHVRVLDETRAFGSIVDTACIRSLDCLAACPHGALSIGPVPPAPIRRRRTAANVPGAFIPLRADLLLAGAFLAAFITLRGLYGTFPMLMAVGAALCITGLLWQLILTLAKRDAAFRRIQWKRLGRIRAPGFALLGAGIIVVALLLHSATIRLMLWHAGRLDSRISATRDDVFNTRITPEDKALAERASALYRAGSSWSSGGFALASTPGIAFRRAWLAMVQGNFAEAEQLLATQIENDATFDAATAELATLQLTRGDAVAAELTLRAALTAEHGPAPRAARLLAQLMATTGDTQGAEHVLRQMATRFPAVASHRAALGEYLLAQGRTSEAGSEIRAAVELSPRDPALARLNAFALQLHDDIDAALDELRRASGIDRARARDDCRAGAQWLALAGRDQESAAWTRAGEATRPLPPSRQAQ